MKAQHRGGDREPRSRNPAPPQIADDHPASRDAIELGDEREAAIVVEMMEELRAEHDVDAPVGERKGEGVGTDGVVHAMPCRRDETERAVDRDGAERESTAARDLPCPPWKIGASRADVEQRRLGPTGTTR